MKKVLSIIMLAVLCSGTAFGWGKDGHAVICKIAENHLQPSAKKTIEKYLGGHSIVRYSSWMDYYRETPEYGFTTSWHGAPVNKDLQYDESLVSSKKGNAIKGLEQAMETLKDYKNLPDSTVAVNIKYVLHIVGDMHCPVHIYYPYGNVKYKVTPPASGPTGLHKVWDSSIISWFNIYSPSEWAKELDLIDKKEAKAIAAGTPREWLHDNAVRCEKHLYMSEPNQKLDKAFMVEAIQLIEVQLLYAGHRLASVLNELF